MTESGFNESTSALFTRVVQMADARGVAIKLTRGSSALKLEFADGQRIVINHDSRTEEIWLAAGTGGMEYDYDGSNWLSRLDGSELFARLAELFDQIIHTNPLNAQPGKLVEINTATTPSFSESQHENGSPLVKIALVGILAWSGYAAFSYFIRDAPDAASAMIEVDPNARGLRSSCDAAMPENGTTHIFPASNIQANSSNTEVTLQNDHGHPFLATFTAPRTVIPYLSVLVNAGQSARVDLPFGQYDLLFSVGDSWCNSRVGFADGANIKLNTTLSVLPQQPLQITAQSSGANTTDIQIYLKSSAPQAEPPAFKFIGNGVMEIARHSDGHYHIVGAINGYSVTYLIDTGASLTSLSAATAQHAGIRDCKPATFRTASGTIAGCTAQVPELTIGTFQMQNVTVAIMPNMEVDLLGMNVLSHFEMKQMDGVMHLSYR